MQLTTDKPKRSLISLTPLIDVVFILLIFFMVATNFTKWKFIELNIGKTEMLHVQDEGYSLIKVKSSQQYELNGRNLDINELIIQIRQRIRQSNEHAVVIQPVGDLPLQSLVFVFDKLKPFAGSNLSLAKDEEAH